MKHDHVLKKLNFDLLTPYPRVLGEGVCVQNICDHHAAFMISFNLICNKEISVSEHAFSSVICRDDAR